MRPMNQQLINDIIDYIDTFYLSNNHTPNIIEIGQALGVSKVKIHRYLVYLEEKGMVEYKRGSIKTPTMLKTGPMNYTGVVGSIPCGEPDDRREEPIEEYVSLPVSIFGSGELYILHASGDSMINAGIDDGDLIVVQKTTTADEGDIVAALTEDGENTLKRMIKKDGRYILHPENDAYDDILVPFTVQGVVVSSIKMHKKV